jgi:formate dehydrogenase maturation protein FdhE
MPLVLYMAYTNQANSCQSHKVDVQRPEAYRPAAEYCPVCLAPIITTHVRRPHEGPTKRYRRCSLNKSHYCKPAILMERADDE